MNILITGSCGMLGQYLCKHLAKKNNIFKISKRNIIEDQYLSIDFLDFKYNSIRKLKKFVQPDIIIHAAALTNVDLCEKDQLIAKKINYDSTKKLIKIFEGVKIIFISSDAVFGEKAERFEYSDVSPINYYGKTKVLSENLILKQKKGIVIRTTPIGINILDKNSFVDRLFTSLKSKKKLHMFKNVLFNPIHSEILTNYIEKLIISKKNGIWHINGKEISSKYDFAISFCDKLGIDKKLIVSSEYKDKMLYALRSKNQVLRCNKFEDEFNLEMPNLQSNINKIAYNLNNYDK